MSNYVIGRGKLYFASFLPGTTNPGNFEFLGNAPQFEINIDTSDVKHYKSTGGLKELDESIVLEVTRTGSLELDEIMLPNVAKFLFGVDQSIAVTAASGITESITSAKKGSYFPLGISSTNPAGLRNLTNFSATKNGGGALVDGTDYTFDGARGLVHLLPGATAFSDGDTIDMTYDQVAYTRETVESGDKPVEGALRFDSFNANGPDSTFYMPKVKIKPAGALSLIGDDWQKIPLSVEFLKLDDSTAAIYRDNTPLV